MPYTVGDGAIIEVSIRSRLQQQRCINMFHFQYNTSAGPLDGRSIIDKFNLVFNSGADTAFIKKYRDALCGDVNIEEVVYQWVHPERRARVVKVPTYLTGGVIGTAAPANMSAFIEKFTDLPGRKGHGGVHMFGLTLEGLQGGELSAAGVAVYSGLVDKLPQTLNETTIPASFTPLVYSRSQPATSPLVTGAETKLTVRTAHQRTVGVGE